MELLEPEKGVLDKKLANGAAMRSIEIDSLPPRRSIPVAKVRSELAQIVSFRPEMVVHDVENNSEPLGMCGVHQPLERKRTPVTILDGKRIDAVVTPIAGSWKLCEWHQFNRGDTEVRKLRQKRDDAIQRSRLRIRAPVEFVEDALLEARSFPLGIGPLKRIQVDDCGRAVDTLRLKPRCGIRVFF